MREGSSEDAAANALLVREVRTMLLFNKLISFDHSNQVVRVTLYFWFCYVGNSVAMANY